MKRIILIVIVLVTAGCAKPGISRYDFTPAEYYEVKNELILDQSFENTWDILVEQLASSFYVINNIEKSSRLINVSFSSSSPEKYVDCGESVRYYERGKEYEEFRYKVAESVSYKMAGVTTISSPMTTYVERKTKLEGRANIYVAPVEGKTKITVNVRYILTMVLRGQHALENKYGKVVRYEQMPSSSSSLTFSTNVEHKENLGNSSNPFWVSCFSTGKLEEDILSFAQIDH